MLTPVLGEHSPNAGRFNAQNYHNREAFKTLVADLQASRSTSHRTEAHFQITSADQPSISSLNVQQNGATPGR